MVELDMLTNQVSEHQRKLTAERGRRGSAHRQCLLNAHIALLVLIAVTSESSYSAIGQFSIIYDRNESLET